MKRFLVVGLLMAVSAWANPFLVSDPDPTGAADKCVWQEGTGTPVETPVAAIPPSTIVGSCKIDLASFTPGAHTLQVSFKSTLWGVSSVTVPFTFTKPAASGTGPVNLRVSP